jgi:YD repeat-containing protein
VHEPIANRYLFFRYRQDDSGLIEGVGDAEDRIVYFNYDNLSRLATVYDPVTLGETQGESFSGKPIPDNNAAGVTHIVRVTRREPIGLVELRQAQLSHPRPADLTLRLISPRGTEVALTKRTTAGSGWILDGMLLDSFLGEDPSGEWRLIVTDRAAGQTGFLQVFKMVFSEPANATHFSYNAAHQLTEARASDGARLFSNTYDALGRVVAQDDGVDSNELALFTWQESGGTITTSYKDRTGARSVFVHDAGYHLLSTTDPLEQSTTFE